MPFVGVSSQAERKLLNTQPSTGTSQPEATAMAAGEGDAGHHGDETSEEESSVGHHWIIMGPEQPLPLCALCKTWLANQLHPDFGEVCSRCRRDIDKDLKEWYWLMLTRPDGSLVSHEIRRLVASYIWGKEANSSCYCGLCQDKWQAKGRVCSGN